MARKSKLEKIRDKAYALWENQGRPEGRHEDHWREAEAAVKKELTKGSATDKPKSAKTPPKAQPRKAPKRQVFDA